MKRRHNRLVSPLFSLRGRLLFLICLATFPALLFTFFTAENERSAALARAQRNALQLAVMASREHAHEIRGARMLLTWLGTKLTREGRQSVILTDPDFLRGLLAGHPQLANIGALSPTGQVVSSAYPLSSYESWSDNPAYRAALESNRVEVGSYLVSPIFRRHTLNHAYAIRDVSGEVTSVLFNGLNLDWLGEMTRHALLPEGLTLYITDRTGHVLASTDEQGPSVSLDERRIPGIVDLAQSKSGTLVDLGDTGGRSFVVVAPLEEVPGLFVAAAAPYDQLIGEANAAFYRTLLSLGILTLFTIVSVFVATELGILRRLRSLARAAQRLGAGDLSVRAQLPRGRDEFTSLVRAFNEMADSLAARHTEAVSAQHRLRALASRLHVAREEEAARISRELHDEMGQALTALKIELSRLRSCCPAERQGESCAVSLEETLTEISDRISTMVDLVRRLSSELRPSVLDRLGLIPALQWLATEIEGRTDLVVQVEAENECTVVEENVAVTLFRIAQEALTNAVRYAEAGMVEISLERIGPDVVLTVRDDGKGIPRDAINSVDSLGIIGMQERAALVNGRLAIDGGPGQGTTVSAAVPAHLAVEIPDAHPAS